MQREGKAADVVATNQGMRVKAFSDKNSGKGNVKLIWIMAATASMAAALPLTAAVLPEDRFDALFHYYDGGGITIDGPSILARKQINNNVSIVGNYYVDAISSASIDVVTSASPYTEKRTEHSVGINYLHEKSILNLGYISSEENDFEAKSMYFSISQSVFGDLTTLSMGYAKGHDNIFRTLKTGGIPGRDPNFAKEADRQSFSIGLSQVITKHLITNINYDLITDTGYLNNPYRTVRYTDGSRASEEYPNTRTSNAVSISANYYLPYRAALHGTYRVFGDTWGIQASNYEIGYTHPLDKGWVFSGHYRKYSQTQASFYRDLFNPLTTYTYLGSDKELSTFDSWTVGLEASYEFNTPGWRFIDKGSINFKYNYMAFNYENFSDLRGVSIPTGNEQQYAFSANIIQAYLSLWY